MRQRAYMIFMGMGGDNANQCRLATADKQRIRHFNAVDCGTCNLLKSYTTVNHQPFAGMAVQVEIHADFAATTQRQKPEILVSRTHQNNSAIQLTGKSKYWSGNGSLFRV